MAKVVFLICILASMVACILSQGKITKAAKAKISPAAQSEAARKKPSDSCCCHFACPSGWTRFQSRCYKFNGTVDTQPNAEAACNEVVFYDQVTGACNEVVFYDQVTGYKLAGEAHLASINSQEEQYFVFDLWQHSLIWPHGLVPGSINVNTRNAQWIGAEKNSDNQWTWSDGSFWSFTMWDTGITNGYVQPDNTGSCAHMWTAGYLDAPGNWNDYWCEGASIAKIPHTCEIGLIRHCE